MPHKWQTERDPTHGYRMPREADVHPLFYIVEGPIEPWEKVK